MDRQELAARIDHTLLAPEATRDQIVVLAEEAAAWGCASACVTSPWVAEVAARVAGTATVACSVIGFPSGAHLGAVKAEETRRAVGDGAGEVDMVINLGFLFSGEDDLVAADIAAVVAAAGDAIVKVIIESAVLDLDRIDAVSRMAVAEGAAFVKTSTGFHPAGGASLEAVRTMRRAVGTTARIKASGGIRTFETAAEMIAAGADRLGASATATILAGTDGSGRGA